jgi:hypothetical protein
MNSKYALNQKIFTRTTHKIIILLLYIPIFPLLAMIILFLNFTSSVINSENKQLLSFKKEWGTHFMGPSFS